MSKYFPILFLLFILGCTSTNKDFIVEKPITEYSKTDFVPTLESKISKTNNTIYGASLLYAWDELKKELNFKDIEFKDNYVFSQLIKSNSYKDVLNEDEFSTSIVREGSEIKVTASFQKSFEFAKEFESFPKDFQFKGRPIRAFGIEQKINDLEENIEIVFYKNDNNFILKLLPKNSEHEIIIAKSNVEHQTIMQFVKEISRKTKRGILQRKQEIYRWKYRLNNNDKILIPNINFNIKKDYETLENFQFESNNEMFEFISVNQTNAFLLNEYGAKVKSEAEMSVKSVEEIEDKPKVKNLVFDKDFILLLKRKETKNPYFAIMLRNEELMVAND